jgi:hypothetical protein
MLTLTAWLQQRCMVLADPRHHLRLLFPAAALLLLPRELLLSQASHLTFLLLLLPLLSLHLRQVLLPGGPAELLLGAQVMRGHRPSCVALALVLYLWL